MRILYFGTVCNFDEYNRIMENSRSKPSIASMVFETALLKGFHENGMDVKVVSFPMILYFPKSDKLFFGGKKEQLECGYDCYWLNTVNLPFVKQISRRLDARGILKKWLSECSCDDVVFTYSIPPFLVKDIIELCENYSVKKVAIIPDLLKDMYINENEKAFSTKLRNRYLKKALELQSEYDGYIYLTEAMKNVVAPGKPYMIMEGIADTENCSFSENKEEKRSKAIMYAGMLHEKYGIINLLDAFEKSCSREEELWLFGNGTAVEHIVERAKLNPQIKYFGSLEHNTILEYEKKAWILVNPRNPDDEFTEYSFPSKTIEYMLSGTPVLTTKLKGIPNEYGKHVFFAENNNADTLSECMRKIFSLSEDEINAFGSNAKKFILSEKNHFVQTKKIIDFIEEVINGGQNKDRRT